MIKYHINSRLLICYLIQVLLFTMLIVLFLGIGNLLVLLSSIIPLITLLFQLKTFGIGISATVDNEDHTEDS